MNECMSELASGVAGLANGQQAQMIRTKKGELFKFHGIVNSQVSQKAFRESVWQLSTLGSI